jgi:hypothetical protein
MAKAHPEVVREIAKQGHTIGTHTWSHPDLAHLSDDNMKAQIESAFAEVEKAAGEPIAPFFRYPYLSTTQAADAYLASRDIAQFSIDIDSLDWRTRSAQRVVDQAMAQLDARGRGIILLHDIHDSTALALPALLTRLKEKGFKVVHLRPTASVRLVATEIPPSGTDISQPRPRASTHQDRAKGKVARRAVARGVQIRIPKIAQDCTVLWSEDVEDLGSIRRYRSTWQARRHPRPASNATTMRSTFSPDHAYY